jgi:hypothetical protein
MFKRYHRQGKRVISGIRLDEGAIQMTAEQSLGASDAQMQRFTIIVRT